MITEDYVSFEVAKLLKEKGFDCNTNCYYIEDSSTRTLFYSPIRENHNASIENNEFNIHINISSGKMSFPTLQMATKWLREVHKLYVNVCPCVEGYYWAKKWHSYVENLEKRYPFGRFIGTFNSHKQACEEGIKYCLENLI